MAGVTNKLRRSVQLRWRRIKWLFFKSVFVAFGVSLGISANGAGAERPRLGPFEQPRPKQLSIPTGTSSFDVEEALHGTYASEELCARIKDSLWVVVEEQGDCIRYYEHGLSSLDRNPRVLVYFSGDVMVRTRQGVRSIVPSYSQRSPDKIEEEMSEWSQRAGIPAIFLARPGIYGSSGDHNARRLPREIELMNQALSLLKARYGISEFILTGHSAGGQIVSAMLNKRADIRAGIMSSALVSVKQVAAFWENRREIPGSLLYNAQAFYDPVDEIKSINRDPAPEIYLISDPGDRAVPFFTQLYYVRRLRTEGFNPHHIYSHAPPPGHHLLAEHAKCAAEMVAKGSSSEEIRRALHELDLANIRSATK